MAKLRLEIVTPGGREFAGDVDSVVIPASEGEMGILPMHVPVLTALSPGELRIGNDGREERLVVGNGFAEIEASLETWQNHPAPATKKHRFWI